VDSACSARFYRTRFPAAQQRRLKVICVVVQVDYVTAQNRTPNRDAKRLAEWKFANITPSRTSGRFGTNVRSTTRKQNDFNTSGHLLRDIFSRIRLSL